MWQELQPLVAAKPARKDDRRGNSVMWGFATLTHQDFDPYDLLFYDQENVRPDGSRIKVVRPEVEPLITPLSLAVWFMDDGSTGRNASIATNGFTGGENDLLAGMLARRFGVEAKVRTDGQYFWLALRKKDKLSLGRLIDDKMVPCMRYKWLGMPGGPATERKEQDIPQEDKEKCLFSTPMAR
jgi:hypothetical protein